MIKLKKEELKNYSYNKKKRINQKNFNILNYEKLEKLKYEEDEKNQKRYRKYDKELENIKIYKNKEYDIYKIELENHIIYLRDNIEKSFFFNKYFSNEYIEEKNEFNNFIDFHKSKDFYIIDDLNIIILDFKNDLIKK